MPGSIAELANRLRQIGIKANVEVDPVESVPVGLHLLYLSVRNSFVHMNQIITTFIHCSFGFKSVQPSITVPTGNSNTITPPKQAKVLQQKVSQPPPSKTPDTRHQNKASGSTSSAAVQHQQISTNSDNDYMILCSDDRGWLTTREDVNVSNIKSDEELFGVFRNQLHGRYSWTRRFASLRTVQKISFVKVRDLHEPKN